MKNPNPINLTSDDYWRNLGWPAVARDRDGHAISTCVKDGHEATFNEWLRECFDDGLTVTNLSITGAAMTALHPLPDAAGAYFASDPAYLVEHADWRRHRYEAHVSAAFTFHRLARRRLRRGLIGLARDDYRVALRHMRMARHFRRKLL